MKKFLIGALIIFLIGIIGTVVLGGSALSFNLENFNEEKSLLVEETESLVIKSDISKISIEEIEGNKINVKYHGRASERVINNLNFEVQKDGSTVYVTASGKENKKAWFSFPFSDSGSRKLNIEIPKQMFEKVNIQSNIGKIQINELTATELSVSSDIGNIEIGKFHGESVDVESNIGEVTIAVVDAKVYIQTDTGEVNLSVENVTKDIGILSDIGEVNVNFINEPKNITFDLASNIGDVSLKGFESINTEKNRALRTSLGSGGPTVRIQTDIGEITVKH